MLCALAHGANVNFMNPTEELKCPLIASILAVRSIHTYSKAYGVTGDGKNVFCSCIGKFGVK